MKQRGTSPWTPETTSPQPLPRPPKIKQPRQPSQRRLSGTLLALVVGAVVFAVVVAVVVAIGPRHYRTEAGTAVAVAPTTLPTAPDNSVPPTPTTTEPAPTTQAPTTTQAMPSGYMPESGPGGIEVNIPAGWNVTSPFASEDEADAPDGSGSLIRYGGTPSSSMSLLDAVSSDVASNTSVKTGYQQLQLNTASSPSGDDTVVWEFLFDKNGVQRHVLSWFWRANGYDYVLYFSSTAANWPSMQPAVTTGEQTAGPT